MPQRTSCSFRSVMNEVGPLAGCVFGLKLGCNVVMGLSLSLRNLNEPFNRRDRNDRALLNDLTMRRSVRRTGSQRLGYRAETWEIPQNDLEVYAVGRKFLEGKE